MSISKQDGNIIMRPVIASLKSLPLFSFLADDTVAEMVSKMQIHHLEEGDVIVRQGEEGGVMYVILSGTVKISLEDPHGRELVLSNRGPYDVIGETSLIDLEPRAATVSALTPLELLSLTHGDLMASLGEQSSSALETMQDIVAQLRVDYQAEILQKLPLFADLPQDMLQEIARKMAKLDLAKDEELFHKGDPGDALYVIRTGWVKIVTEDALGEELILNQCGPSDAIGEMSLVDGQPRSASVIALSDAEVLRLSRDDFLSVLDDRPALALDIIRNISARLRFATTYIEEAIEWSKRIAEGDYTSAIDQIQATRSSEDSDDRSDADKASELLSAFFTMIQVVKEREDKLRQQLRELTIQIDEAKRQEEFDTLTGSDFFKELKESAQKMRDQNPED
ncbi:MAG: cyclic nucleotide-binding domain-containing protein [Anaerolineae bacterium]|nr:cyclic nucleotide-binding domain-containing protein [Anaerolineae bacterium]